MGTLKNKKSVCLTLEPETYGRFRDFCFREGYAISRRIEILIARDLKDNENKNEHMPDTSTTPVD
jgi:hypothetical protein